MFENLLQLAADEDKATLTTMATKYPTLKSYFEMGEKVEPVRERLRALSADYESNLDLPVAELEKWRKFKTTDWPSWQENHTRAEAALQEAQEKITELEATRGTDMTPDEVKAVVAETLKAAGVVDKATLDSSLAKFKTDEVLPTVNSTVNGLTLRFEDVFDKIEEVRDRHRDLYGENIRPKDVFKFMQDNKLTDPEEAWGKMTAEKLATKTKTQTEAEKKAEYEKGVAEGKKAALQEVGSSRSPVDGQGGSVARPGALMRRAQARMPKTEDGKVDSSKIPLGKGISRAMTQEYFEKKAGAVQ